MGFLMMMSFVFIMIGAAFVVRVPITVGCWLLGMKSDATFCTSSTNARSIAVSQS